MYRPTLTPRTRFGTIVLVVLVHVGLGLALLHLSGRIDLVEQVQKRQSFDITLPPPPPPPPPPPKPQPKPRPKPQPKQAPARAAPPARLSKATPVVKPIPEVIVPAKPPIVAAPVAGVGAQSTQGASTAGTGSGAGGAGNGTGSGGSGSGGGGGGIGTRPTLASPALDARDFPPGLIDQWPRGARVLVAVRVQLDGRGTDCKINRSSGDPGIDAETCRLVMTRLRFRPATDTSGRPMVAWYGYAQEIYGR